MIQQPVTAYTPAVLVQTVPITTTTAYIIQTSPPLPLPQVHVLVSGVCVLHCLSIISYPYAVL